MKCFHTTTYNLYNKNNIKILIMNDIHFSKYIKDKKLNYIVNYINKEQPNYILIPGDLIDNLNILNNEKDRLFNWLKKISKNSIVLFSLGNHDIFERINGKRYYKIDEDFFNELRSINNIHVLNNQVYEDDNLYVCGITQNFKYFWNEKIDLLIEDLDNNKELLNPNTAKIKILMIHSPNHFDKDIIKEKVNKYDYIICGHMHNGCVPPIINEIWRSTRGFITPTKKFFGRNERNTLRKESDKLLVNGPITTFQHMSGIFKRFNFLYPTYISIMNFNNKNKFKITKKYHKFK